MATANPLARFELINGIPADIWLTNEALIGTFIKQHQLAPVVHHTAAIPAAHARESLDIERIGGINGGMKVPHFHYRGEFYLLKPKQWREFSSAVVKELTQRLADSSNVSFHELLDLSSAASSIMR